MNNILNKLTFAFELTTVDSKMNAYKNKEFNLLSKLDNKWISFIFSKSIPLQLGYNMSTQKNYVFVCMAISNRLTEELIKELEKECTEIILNEDLKSNFSKIEVDLKFIDEVKAIPFLDVEKSRDFMLLRSLTYDIDSLKRFERFSKSILMLEHLTVMCIKNHLCTKSDKVYTFETLPIHSLDIATNTILINKKVIPYFNIFNAAVSLIDNYELSDIQNEIARLMLLDISFGEFVLMSFKDTKVDGDEEKSKSNIDSAMTKIIKKAKSIVKKNKISEKYYNLLMKDLS